jgi:hypothetical protein
MRLDPEEMAMKRLFKLLVVLLSLAGVATVSAGGYLAIHHPELIAEYWEARQAFVSLSAERREAVMADAPARARLEWDLQDDLRDLAPATRDQLLLELSREEDAVRTRWAARVAGLAEAARAKSAAEAATQPRATETITPEPATPAAVEPDIVKPVTPAQPALPEPKPEPVPTGETRPAGPLDEVLVHRAALEGPKGEYSRTLVAGDGNARIDAAVDVLRALDQLAQAVQEARRAELSNPAQRKLAEVVQEAKYLLYTVRQTPGLQNNEEARELLQKVPATLND